MTHVMLSNALRNVCGPLADFMAKLTGPDGNTKWLPAFKRFLRGENPWDGKPLFGPWMTVTIGGRPSMSHLIQAVQDEGFVIQNFTKELLLQSGTSIATAVEQVDLVKITVGNLGFIEPVAYFEVCRRLLEVGLSPCTPEMAVEARRPYVDQDRKEYADVVMSPLEYKNDKYALGLAVDDDTGKLAIYVTDTGDLLTPSATIICVQPRT